MLLIDEVYRDFRPGALGTARTLGENVVILSSFTKVYGLGNLRAGWILGPRELVGRLRAMMDVMESIGPTPAAICRPCPARGSTEPSVLGHIGPQLWSSTRG